MKKIILSVIGVGLILLTILTITTNQNRPGIELYDLELYDNYLEENDMDPDMFNTFQKQIIFDHKLTIKEDLHESSYVTPSANPAQFERHWGISSLVDENADSELDIKAYYFENQHDQKIVLLSFVVPYHVIKEQSNQFIHISHSLNYLLRVSGAISYEQNDSMYLLDTFLPSEFINSDNARPYTINMPGISLVSNDLYTENQIGIPFNDETLGYFNYSDITYNYVIELQNSEDNQSEETDDYVGLDIDFYTLTENSDFNVKVGFNQFYQSRNNYNIFAVKRMSLSYKREES